jgi:hypothetical protein
VPWEGEDAPPTGSNVPDVRTGRASKMATNMLSNPAAEGGSTAGRPPVYGTPELPASLALG